MIDRLALAVALLAFLVILACTLAFRGLLRWADRLVSFVAPREP